MPIRERVFWVVLTVFGGVFGTGIYFLFSPEPRPMHLILTVIGAVGMAATLIERRGTYRASAVDSLHARHHWAPSQFNSDFLRDL